MKFIIYLLKSRIAQNWSKTFQRAFMSVVHYETFTFVSKIILEAIYFKIIMTKRLYV